VTRLVIGVAASFCGHTAGSSYPPAPSVGTEKITTSVAGCIVQYVSLFTIGHSVTLLAGVLGNIHANAYIVDAIIGVSVAYKAFENMGRFDRILGLRPNTRP
jgi:HupE / UreJ protein